MLWSSKDWISSHRIAEDKLALFSDFFNIIRQMLQVNSKNYIISLIISISTILNTFLQIDPSNRLKLSMSKYYIGTLKVLESLAAKTQTDPKVEADWLSFHSLINSSAEFKVDERTLSSRDLYKEITQMNLKAKSGQMATGGTKLRDQKESNFCAYFATLSALRHQLRKIVGSEISGKDTSKISESIRLGKEWQEKEAKRYAGLEINEYLERRDEDEKRFERDLSVMIGCVSPRSLSGRFKITFKNIAVRNENQNFKITCILFSSSIFVTCRMYK